MQNVFNLILSLVMVVAAMAVAAIFLVGLPEVTYVADDGSAWPGGYPTRLLHVLLSASEPDPDVCAGGWSMTACLHDDLMDGSLFSNLTKDSTAKLVRRLDWLAICWALFILVGIANFCRASKDGVSIVAHKLNTPTPITYFAWVYFALAGAYVLDLF